MQSQPQNAKLLQLFACYCCLLIFFYLTFSKLSFRNTIRVSTSLDPNQDRQSVSPDLGPNCLQMLSADKKVAAARNELSRLQ